MSIRDAARASGLSPKALRRRIERGTLGSVLVGGRRRIPVDDLVRRGLVPDGADPAAPTGSSDDGATVARRLRALESRVSALESALSSVTRTSPSLRGREALDGQDGHAGSDSHGVSDGNGASDGYGAPDRRGASDGGRASDGDGAADSHPASDALGAARQAVSDGVPQRETSPAR